MPSRPDALETTLLAIELLRRIPRGRKITASQLHQQLLAAGFDRDLRTIQRQLDTLSQHFEIERDDRSKPYGYQWRPGSSGLSLAQLTAQESLLLHLAGEHLRSLLPACVMRSMEDFFVQAQRNLRDQAHAQLERQWPEKIRVVATSQPLLPPQLAPGVLETVSEALYRNQYLELEYRNASGKCSTRHVMPLGLAQQGPRLYLVCRFDGFDNERSLALHRILAAKSTHHFQRPEHFDLQRYDADGRFGFGEGARIHLSFRIEKTAGFHLYETPLSTDQHIQPVEPDELLVTATVVDSAMLDWWLRGFGSAVREVHKARLTPSSPTPHTAATTAALP